MTYDRDDYDMARCCGNCKNIIIEEYGDYDDAIYIYYCNQDKTYTENAHELSKEFEINRRHLLNYDNLGICDSFEELK